MSFNDLFFGILKR